MEQHPALRVEAIKSKHGFTDPAAEDLSRRLLNLLAMKTCASVAGCFHFLREDCGLTEEASMSVMSDLLGCNNAVQMAWQKLNYDCLHYMLIIYRDSKSLSLNPVEEECLRLKSEDMPHRRELEAFRNLFPEMVNKRYPPKLSMVSMQV